MSITIPKATLEMTLERAVKRAEAASEIDERWRERVVRIGECPSQSYVAALGTALLAKAADGRIDALSVKAKAGPTAYSMRGVVKVLVEKAPIYGYHLGVTGPEPLNNQPWFHSDRVDRAVGIDKKAQPYHRDMVRYLTQLNQSAPEEAMKGLVAFVALRQKADAEERRTLTSLQVVAKAPIGELLEVLKLFVTEDPESGKRGQALVAALFDLVFDEVKLPSIHNPTGLDVTVWVEGRLILGAEVKQKPVGESAALHLAEEAALRGIDKAVLVALAPQQRHLDISQIRLDALTHHGVLIAAYEGIDELVCAAATASRLSVDAVAAALPNRYLARMREHQVSLAGQQYWSDLCNGLARGVGQLRLG